MYDAIMRQPEAMEEMLTKHTNTVQPVAAELAKKRRIYLVGIGTSWHAALVAGHWFRKFAGDGPVIEVRHSFEFCAYPPPLNGDDGVIVISHRGTKTYSYLALEMSKSSGAYTIAITSTDPGPRIAAADAQLRTVPQERSAAFTISYTCGLMTLGMLAAALGRLDRPQRRRTPASRPPGGGSGGGGAGDGAAVRVTAGNAALPEPRAVYLRGLGAQHRFGLRGGPENQGDQRLRQRGAANRAVASRPLLLGGPRSA